MDMRQQGVCDISLSLELCIGRRNTKSRDHREEPCSPFVSSTSHEPSLNLSLSNGVGANNAVEQGRPAGASSPQSTVSSFSTAYVKKETGVGCEEAEAERFSPRGSDEEDDGGARKKLRLTKEQSALLEDRFKEHSTINPKQKQALAQQLKLRPRQIEVWFQNRRARTKLKQMEVDCEFLKKCCEKLSEENRRLQKELQQLKAHKVAPPPQPPYLHFPAAVNLTMCPSCGRRSDDDFRGEGAAAGSLPVPPKPYLFNPSFLQQHVS